MRIFRIRLKPNVRKLLAEISREFSIEDTGFTEDVFCCIRNKGYGLPSDERIEAMATALSKAEQTMRPLALITLKKRRQVLRNLCALPYFKSLCLAHAADPHVGVRRLLRAFAALSRKVRQAQCVACSLMSKCDFGKQYGQVVTDITKVVDPDYTVKVHEDCPSRPEIDNMNKLSALIAVMRNSMPVPNAQATREEIEEAAKKLKEALKASGADGEGEEDDHVGTEEEELAFLDYDAEDMANDYIPTGLGGSNRADRGFDATNVGAHFAKVSEDLVDKLSNVDLVLYEIGLQLKAGLAKSSHKKFKPTSEVSEKSEVKNLKSTSDLASVAPAQQALDDDHFDARVAKRSLQVRKFQKQEEKKFLLYCLIDCSGSMRDTLGASAKGWSIVSRGQVAATLSIALMQRVTEDGGMVFLRFFADGAGPMQVAKDAVGFKEVSDDIRNQDFNGGGTCLVTAIRTALDDIIGAKSEIRDAEILLITDADDTIAQTEEQEMKDRMAKNNVKMNTLCVNPSGTYGNARTVLPRVSAKYLRVNPSTMNAQQFVELVT